MKANKIRTIWIMIHSVWVTVVLLLATIWQARRGSRDGVDKICRQWSSQLLKIIKLRYHVFNPYHIRLEPNRAYIIMSNHESLYDIPLVFLSFPESVRMIAKKELFKIPLFGHALARADFISIDRSNTKEALKNLENARVKMREGIRLWIAPEGTRSRDGKLGSFKKGGFMLALQTDALIIPVGIRGAGKILPPKTLEFHLNQQVDVHIGQPIDTRSYSIQTRDQLIKTVRESIEQLASKG